MQHPMWGRAAPKSLGELQRTNAELFEVSWRSQAGRLSEVLARATVARVERRSAGASATVFGPLTPS